MALVVLLVLAAFGLLYFAVSSEERRLQEVSKPRKR
jgi:hypothetical protein